MSIILDHIMIQKYMAYKPSDRQSVKTIIYYFSEELVLESSLPLKCQIKRLLVIV